MRLKQFFNLIWNEFVYGGHLLSLGAVSIVYTSAILLNIKITWDFLVIVYLGIYCPYLYNRYKEFNKDFLTNPERTKHLKGFIKYIPIIIAFSLIVIVGIFLYFNKITALLFAIFLLLLSLSYSILFKKLSRKIIGFKSFYASLAWTLLLILLAIYYSYSLKNFPLIVLSVFFYLRFFIGTGFCDIKDIETDKRDGLLTLAVVLGRKNLLNILNLVNILTIIPIIIGVYFRLIPPYSLMLLLSVPYSFYYFKKSEQINVNTNFLYNVLVDGELISWSIFVLLGRFLLW